MNVAIGTVAAQFLFWKYLFRIFGIVYFAVQLNAGQDSANPSTVPLLEFAPVVHSQANTGKSTTILVLIVSLYGGRSDDLIIKNSFRTWQLIT
jgi:hypothetical protein